MIIALHHPEYLPQISWFGRILTVDVMVLLDDIALPDRNRECFISHGRIRGSNGPIRLAVPVLRRPRHALLNEVEINPTSPQWASKHMRSISMSYGRTHGFEQHSEMLHQFYAQHWNKLLPMNLGMIKFQMSALGLSSDRLVLSSSIRRNCPSTRPSDYIQYFGGREYMAGPAELARLSPDERKRIADAGAHLTVHNWEGLKYRQPYQPFLSDLAALDLILSAGSAAPSLLRAASQSRTRS